MNDRYVYGYGMGWNVENEYIASLKEILENYNSQLENIQNVNNNIDEINKKINSNNNLNGIEVTDEQLRAWYNEDYLANNSLISFDAYKRNMLNYLEKTNAESKERALKENQDLVLQLSHKKDEYVANLYYLIDIKENTRKEIFKRKNELNLLLSEKRIQLSSILLEQQKNSPQYDKDGNVINSDLLRQLRDKYDETWLEIRKIEAALKELNYMLTLIDFTKEENDLMMRGLTPKQKEIYDDLLIPTQEPIEVAASKVSQYIYLLEEYAKTLEIYNNDLEILYELQKKYESNEIEHSEYEKHAKYMVERYRYITSLYQDLISLREQIKVENFAIPENLSEIEKPEQPMMIIKDNEKTPIPEPTPESIPEPEPIPEPISEPEPISNGEKGITLEEIVAKVCGEEKFNDGQSSRYAASKIKLFSKPQKNDLGLAYKIVSIPRAIIGIIPKAAMKVYGLFVSKKTKNLFKGMEERANNLTDKEVEIILKEYKGQRAQGFRLPKAFMDSVRPRVNKYVGTKIAVINEQILENLKVINYCEKVITTLKERLTKEESPEMIARMEEVLATAYERAYPAVKDIISLQVEGNELQSGNGLHSFDEEVKALNTKMNYIGGRFSKAREYDPTLWSKISGYSHSIEYSNNPVEVVDSFIERENIYKENTKEKRSIFNLGSKVTAGKLDYRPFVETLNYGNDPFIRDLITSVLVVSSTVSLINNISNNIAATAKQNEIIKEANEKIEEANRIGAEQQQFIDSVRGSGEAIENGTIYDIRHTEGSIENLAERGVNSEYDWNLSGSSYSAADAAHHLETGSLSVHNTEVLLDLSSKYSAGTITHAEYLRGINELKEQTTQVYEKYVNDLSTTLENYASTHPQFDYTAVLSSLKHASSNSGASVELTDLVTDLYEQSLNVSNFESLSAIETTLSSATLVPDILTLGAVTAKVAQEQVDSKKEIRPDSKRTQEIRNTIQSLRELKMELTKEEIEEIENLLR